VGESGEILNYSFMVRGEIRSKSAIAWRGLPVRRTLTHGFKMTIDWTELRAAATGVAGHAYAPYSRLRVGAAGLTADGRVVTGCNVENASFGLTLCAECGLVSALHATAPDAATPVLVAVAVVAGDGDPLLPCGRCRQLLLEAGGPSLLVDTAMGPMPLAELLPAAFGDADLAARAESAEQE
jgi:cytidine deaminase